MEHLPYPKLRIQKLDVLRNSPKDEKGINPFSKNEVCFACISAEPVQNWKSLSCNETDCGTKTQGHSGRIVTGRDEPVRLYLSPENP
jgi:hypothetical protein